MKYTKPHLSYEQQADQLIQRGLIADKDVLISRLKSVSYYRLSGYWHTFRELPSDNFKPNTKFSIVWERYTFDRQLRFQVMDAIERIEIAIRSDLVYYFTDKYGPFGHTDANNLPNLDPDDYRLFINKIRKETLRSKEKFSEHFKIKYGDLHPDLPLWMAAEVIDFGCVFTLYRGVDKSIRRKISEKYKISFGVLETWLHSLNTIRNICAHHSRLWNRELGIKPEIPDKNPYWNYPNKIENNKMFGILSIMKYMISYIAPQSCWQERLFQLLNKYNGIPLVSMGFPDNWKNYKMWEISQNGKTTSKTFPSKIVKNIKSIIGIK